MICFYRYSDKGKNPLDYGYNKSKQDCLDSFLFHFKDCKKIIILDNCDKEPSGVIKFDDVIRTKLGNGASAFWAMKCALEMFNYNESFYFAEDDYFYQGNRHGDWNLKEILEQGLEFSDYATLYDHPDKYRFKYPYPNEYIGKNGEETEVFRTLACHWKYTNSTTMTFAANRKTLEEDIFVMEKYCVNPIPKDFDMFLALGKRGRRIASCLPGLSCHLSPDTRNITPYFSENLI